ncbi:MAG: histidinol dehydrogenase [Bacillaceae bacterium G1]|nr:histidinol dehydrogenase [Bacillota bacterium]OJF17545.1 MAG: histidinol dehydrogenase [Bacillaceae bacterium G1]
MIPVLTWDELLARREAGEADLELIRQRVREIIDSVRRGGDAALLDWTSRLDGVQLAHPALPSEWREAARKHVTAEWRASLEKAAERIRRFHEQQRQRSWFQTEENGTVLGQLVRPLERVGVYVPGGKAAYPSSVLMNVIPAQVAGVQEIVLVTPPHAEGVSPYVLAAAELLGIEEIYCVGGAQAVAALAYGTETIRPVDKIVGPGNIYVAMAKREVFGRVGIDLIAGPSEVVVVGDGTVPALYAACDLLAQAEHDPMAAAILIAADASWAQAVQKAVAEELAVLPRAAIARQALAERGGIVVVGDMEEAMAAANRLAPEHLELLVADPWRWLPKVQHAGAVFLGSDSPEALGDYLAGPNHVLPTSGAARFASALSVDDFIKKTSLIAASPPLLAEVADDVIRLAESEGLQAHARSVAVRKSGPTNGACPAEGGKCQ